MSGRILIVDTVATNRIVLKVKLSAAFYDVAQAVSASEALQMAAREAPDLVLVAENLPDMSFADFVRGMVSITGREDLPLLALAAQNGTRERLALLRAGARDVIGKPLNEPLLLARLRSLLRETHSREDIGMQAGLVDVLGFAEAPSAFARQGRVEVYDDGHGDAVAHSRRLARDSRHSVGLFQADRGAAAPAQSPDVMVLPIDSKREQAGLAALAELRAGPLTRQARIVVLLADAASKLAATVLDMGAHDVIGPETDPREIDLRLSIQIARKQAEEQMRRRLQSGLEAAMIDPLTGLYNRRYALGRMGRMIEQAASSGAGIAVIVADLDHFKSINDTYGHATGDVVLGRVADCLRNALRAEDMLARIGGEEFLIALPDVSREQARQIADRLCRQVREMPIFVPGQPRPLHITISLGVAMAQPAQEAMTPSVDNLMQKADRALYGSKSGGRNTVTFAKRSAA